MSFLSLLYITVRNLMSLCDDNYVCAVRTCKLPVRFVSCRCQKLNSDNESEESISFLF